MTRHNANLPALPGGVGVLSDRKEVRAAMRPIALMHTSARLRLYLTLLNAGYGREL